MRTAIMSFATCSPLRIPASNRSATMSVGAVQCAIANGYRHIDTAPAYGKERQVGEGLRGSGVDRSEMFITPNCG
jgi:2,5-diketo-D-gluconate reductase A